MRFFQTFDIAASGMKAEQFRMDVITNNIANAHTSKTDAGTPYRRQVAMVDSKAAFDFAEAYKQASMNFELDLSEDFGQLPGGPGTKRVGKFTGGYRAGGVEVSGVVEDQGDFRWVYEPTNPNAEKDGPHQGYVAMPNVNIIQEMTSMMQASRAYEANATMIEASKAMAMKALEIGKG